MMLGLRGNIKNELSGSILYEVLNKFIHLELKNSQDAANTFIDYTDYLLWTLLDVMSSRFSTASDASMARGFKLVDSVGSEVLVKVYCEGVL